eukprot:365734-Chlamydomonas_euryale.AAC.23
MIAHKPHMPSSSQACWFLTLVTRVSGGYALRNFLTSLDTNIGTNISAPTCGDAMHEHTLAQKAEAGAGMEHTRMTARALCTHVGVQLMMFRRSSSDSDRSIVPSIACQKASYIDCHHLRIRSMFPGRKASCKPLEQECSTHLCSQLLTLLANAHELPKKIQAIVDRDGACAGSRASAPARAAHGHRVKHLQSTSKHTASARWKVSRTSWLGAQLPPSTCTAPLIGAATACKGAASEPRPAAVAIAPRIAR